MSTMQHHGPVTLKFFLRTLLSITLNTIIFGGLLFGPAGTWDWWRAWVFMGLITVGTVSTMLGVFVGNLELLEERLKPPIQPGQPLVDKILVVLLIAAFAGQIAVIPLDVFHWHLLPQPGPLLASLGLVLAGLGWLIISLTFKENAFAAPVVKHQVERHQRVVDSGVYSIVRHPMYAGAALFLAGMALWLESAAGALLAAVPTAILAVRIRFEEAFLKRELKGYEEYTRRVRYRLIPLVW